MLSTTFQKKFYSILSYSTREAFPHYVVSFSIIVSWVSLELVIKKESKLSGRTNWSPVRPYKSCLLKPQFLMQQSHAFESVRVVF